MVCILGVWESCKCVKMRVFPSFGAFWGVYSCLFGFGRLGWAPPHLTLPLFFFFLFFLYVGFVFVAFALFFVCFVVGVFVALFFSLFYGGLFYFLVCFVCLLVLECVSCLFSCCVFWFDLVLSCVCWSGLGVVLVLFILGLFWLFLSFVCLCLFLSVSYGIIVFPATLVFFCLMLVQSFLKFCLGCLLLCFVCHLFQDVPLLFFCLLSCFILNRRIRFSYCCHPVFLLSFVFVFLWSFVFLDFWLPIKNISPKIGNSENPKYEKCRKTDI